MKFSRLTKSEIEGILTKANFTDEEAQIFRMLCRGSTISEIAYRMSICDRTVNRKIKEMHRANTPQDKEAKMRDLEKYMKELSADITDLMSGMSQEEINMAKSKLTTLVSKM